MTLPDLTVDAGRSAVGVISAAATVAVEGVSGFAPPGDIHRMTTTGDVTAISIHVYGTDVNRIGSSVRRYC